MRVTGNSYTENLVRQLNTLTARQYRLQNQAATGQRIDSPEDDPAAMQRAMALRAENRGTAQFSSNIATLKERATASYNALRALQKISDRVSELATLADGTRSPEELKVYAREVTQLTQQAAQLMNSKHGDQYLFGGTASGAAPFTVTTDADGNVTAVTYGGNTSVAAADIAAGVALAVDVPGENNTGTGPRGLVSDSRSGADFFAHLISLQNHLLAGDTAAIGTTDRPALQRDEDNFIYHLGGNGAIQTRLETAGTLTSNRSLSLTQMISREVDADLAQTIVELNQAQTAYSAALQSGAGILRMSLMDYLR